ncbi:MAG: hypothetical protein ABJD07_08405 [Gemmatimonadaceae bacterium]
MGDMKDGMGGPASSARHNTEPSAGDLVGEGVGGVSGVVAGAAIGSLAGPIGTIIGGIAGAASGWWAGRTVSEAMTGYTPEDDKHYRDSYEKSSDRLADRSYDDVRPAYQLGHVAAANPDYSGKKFDEIEGDLRKGWDSAGQKAKHEWEHVRGYVNDAYTRSGTRRSSAASTFSAHAPNAVGGLNSDDTNG